MKLTYGTAPLTPLDILEICLTIVCIALGFAAPAIGGRWFSSIEQKLRVIAQRRWLCICVVGLLPIGLRLLLLPVYGVPVGSADDELSYLLQADTFASGRLTNPSPPLPERFASSFILVKPTYTSQYQPAQAFVLAIGQKLTGCAWAGVVASMGLFCIVLYWALLAWLPSIWALAGAGLMGIEVGVLSYWINSYWGGCVPAIGGALALGGLARLGERHQSRDAFTTAVGLVILVTSRSLEGGLLAIITAAALVYWLFVTNRLGWAVLLRSVAPPIALVLGAGILFMGYYNYRVTGRATEFPYLVYRQQYAVPQGFLWQKTIKANAPMPLDVKAVYDHQVFLHEYGRSAFGAPRAAANKVRRFWDFYIGVPLTVALIFLPFIWREPHMKLALVGLLIVLGLDNMTFFDYFPHYSAPIAVLIVLAVMQCVRRMRASGRAGLFLSRSLPIVCVIGLIVPMAGRFLEPYLDERTIHIWQEQFRYPEPRERFVQWLERQSGKQLVIVRYVPLPEQSKVETILKLTLQRLRGWVYNRADLSTAKTVWVRDADAQSNRELLKYFPDRKVWLAEPDGDPPRLLPYSDTVSQDSQSSSR